MAAPQLPPQVVYPCILFSPAQTKALYLDGNDNWHWVDDPLVAAAKDSLVWEADGDVITSVGFRIPQYTVATKPAAGTKGKLIFLTDTNEFQYDDGTNWITVASGSAGGSGWTDDGTMVRLTTVTDVVGIGTVTQFGSSKVTIQSDNMLALRAATAPNRTWTTAYASQWGATSGGPYQTLILNNDGSAGLPFNLVNVTGGQRLWIWDPANAGQLLVHPSTSSLPAFAVYGDLTIGDIWTFSPSGNAYIVGGRTTANLVPATDITHYMCARKTAGNDTDGGATIDLYPTDNNAGATNDGIVELMAAGRGSAALANSIFLSNRSAANTITRRWQMGGPGDNGGLYPFTNNAYSLGSLASAAHAVAAGAGTGSGNGFVPSVINLQAGVGTGSPGNTSENDLKTYTLPANSFVAASGDCIRVIMTFRCAANATTKRLRIYFAGTVISDSTAIANNNQTFMVIALINNTGANTQFNFCYAMGNTTNSAWSTALTGSANFVGTSATMTASQIIKATVTLGAGAAVNDVIQDTMIVEYLRNAA